VGCRNKWNLGYYAYVVVAAECGDDQFMCIGIESRICVPWSFWCDGLIDCFDESDEVPGCNTSKSCILLLDLSQHYKHDAECAVNPIHVS